MVASVRPAAPRGGEDAPLDAGLRALTGYRLRRTTGIVMAEFTQVFAEFGLRRTTYSVLSLVVENPGIRQSQLAEALAIDRPNLVQIVDELEGAGLISRKRAKDDGRAKALMPTEAGQARYDAAQEKALAEDAKLTAGLTRDEEGALLKALTLIEDHAIRALAARGKRRND